MKLCSTIPFIILIVTALYIAPNLMTHRSSFKAIHAEEYRTIVVTPTEDTYICLQRDLDKNYGYKDHLFVSTAGDYPYYATIMKFDLSSIPEGTIVMAAVLKLYVFRVDGEGAVSAYLVGNSSWRESELTGRIVKRSAEQMDPSQFKNMTATDEVEVVRNMAWYSLNLTRDVINTGREILSEVIVGLTYKVPNGIIGFYSKDGPLEYKPYLEVLLYENPGETYVYLLVMSNYKNTPIELNGTEYFTDANKRFRIILRAGAVVNLTVPTVIYRAKNIRDSFIYWDDGITSNERHIKVSENQNISAIYKRQYYLTVTSPYGVTSGSGWYDEGSTAIISVNDIEQAEGVMGRLGASYKFSHWSGWGSSHKLEITVNNPYTISAVWKKDYTDLYTNLLKILIIPIIFLIITFSIKKYLNKTPKHRKGWFIPLVFTHSLELIRELLSSHGLFKGGWKPLYEVGGDYVVSQIPRCDVPR